MDRNDNSKGRRVSCAQGAYSLARCVYFKLGYEDASKGRSYNYGIESKVDAIAYARGRAFAIWTRVNREKASRWRNGVLSRAGEERLLQAMYSGALI